MCSSLLLVLPAAAPGGGTSTRVFLLFLLFLQLLMSLSVSSSNSNSEDIPAAATSSYCLEKGFQLGSLDCLTCPILQETLNDEELHLDCLKCCQEGITKSSRSVEEEEEVFEYAILEVDKHWGTSEQIQSIIKKKKSLNLKVKYTFGVRPQLLLYKTVDDDVNAPAETVSVWNWQDGMIEEYLTLHVKSSKKSATVSSQVGGGKDSDVNEKNNKETVEKEKKDRKKTKTIVDGSDDDTDDADDKTTTTSSSSSSSEKKASKKRKSNKK